MSGFVWRGRGGGQRPSSVRAWYNVAKDFLGTGGFTNFPRSLPSSRRTRPVQCYTLMMVWWPQRGRTRGAKESPHGQVQIEFSEPMVMVGDKLNFLSGSTSGARRDRRSTPTAVLPRGPRKSLGKELKGRDSPPTPHSSMWTTVSS